MAPTTRSAARSAPRYPTNVEVPRDYDKSVQPAAVGSVEEAAVSKEHAVLRFLWALKLFDALVAAVLLEAISSQSIQRELNPDLTYTQIQVRPMFTLRGDTLSWRACTNSVTCRFCLCSQKQRVHRS